MSLFHDLSVRIGLLTLRNPICVAAGPTGMGDDFKDWDSVGAYFTQGITVQPNGGNSGERLFDAQAGLINRVGLDNPGLNTFLDKKLPNLLQKNVPIITNVVGSDLTEYKTLVTELSKTGVSGIELNFSCPNYGQDLLPQSFHILEEVRGLTDLPLIVKLGYVSNHMVGWVIKNLKDSGANAVTLINSVPAAHVKVPPSSSGNLQVEINSGGLSGPAIKPLALRMVLESRDAGLPIFGVGGIQRSSDVLEFLAVGASAVQVGSSLLVNQHVVRDLAQGLSSWCGDKPLSTYQWR